MLVKLPHGMAVNPEVVKLIHVKIEAGQRGLPPRFSVQVRTDDETSLVLASFSKHEQAVALAGKCARQLNLGLGEEDPGPPAPPEPKSDAGKKKQKKKEAKAKPKSEDLDWGDDDDW